MTKSDLEAFSRVFKRLCEAIGKNVEANRCAVYFAGLQQYSIQEVQTAALNLMRTHTDKFNLPLIADFVNLLDGSQNELASNAWYVYLRALKVIGPERTVNLEDRITHQVCKELKLWGIDIEEHGYPDDRLTGGVVKDERPDGTYWIPARSDQTAFIRAEFIKRYCWHLRHSDPRDLPDRMTGANELNMARNFELYGARWDKATLFLQNRLQAECSVPLTLKAVEAKRLALAAERKALPMSKTTPKQLGTPTGVKTDFPTPEELQVYRNEFQELGAKLGLNVARATFRGELTDAEIEERRAKLKDQLEDTK